MSIEGVTSAQIIQKLKGIEESAGQSADQSGAAAGSDEVDISGDARLAQTLNRAMEAIEDTPEVREDKVADVRQKVEAGHYNSDEVIDQVASEVTDVFLGR